MDEDHLESLEDEFEGLENEILEDALAEDVFEHIEANETVAIAGSTEFEALKEIDDAKQIEQTLKKDKPTSKQLLDVISELESVEKNSAPGDTKTVITEKAISDLTTALDDTLHSPTTESIQKEQTTGTMHTAKLLVSQLQQPIINTSESTTKDTQVLENVIEEDVEESLTDEIADLEAGFSELDDADANNVAERVFDEVVAQKSDSETGSTELEALEEIIEEESHEERIHPKATKSDILDDVIEQLETTQKQTLPDSKNAEVAEEAVGDLEAILSNEPELSKANDNEDFMDDLENELATLEDHSDANKVAAGVFEDLSSENDHNVAVQKISDIEAAEKELHESETPVKVLDAVVSNLEETKKIGESEEANIADEVGNIKKKRNTQFLQTQALEDISEVFT